MAEETFEVPRGVELFVRSWAAEGKPRGVVVLQHGFKAHSGLYAWPAEQLQKLGFAVYAMDLRGHGKSSGERYYVEKLADLVDDLHALITRAKAQHPGLPVFLLGHSAGGVVSCMYALEHPGELAGLVCESFAYQVPAPDFVLAVLKGLSHIAPHAHVLDLEDIHFSRDPAFVAQMGNDPLIPAMSYPSLSVAEMVRADERLTRDFPLVKLPLFILHGTADVVTKPSGSERFFSEAGSTDKKLELYEGHVHDLLNDIGKERVMGDITAWITAHLPAS